MKSSLLVLDKIIIFHLCAFYTFYNSTFSFSRFSYYFFKNLIFPLDSFSKTFSCFFLLLFFLICIPSHWILTCIKKMVSRSFIFYEEYVPINFTHGCRENIFILTCKSQLERKRYLIYFPDWILIPNWKKNKNNRLYCCTWICVKSFIRQLLTVFISKIIIANQFSNPFGVFSKKTPLSENRMSNQSDKCKLIIKSLELV